MHDHTKFYPQHHISSSEPCQEYYLRVELGVELITAGYGPKTQPTKQKPNQTQTSLPTPKYVAWIMGEK